MVFALTPLPHWRRRVLAEPQLPQEWSLCRTILLCRHSVAMSDPPRMAMDHFTVQETISKGSFGTVFKVLRKGASCIMLALTTR